MRNYFARLRAWGSDNRWKSAGIVLLALFAVWYLFFRGGSVTLQTLVVHPGDFAEQITVAGTVVAAQDVDLGFAQSGRVSHVYASVGQHVGAGALLAEIENGDLRAAIAQKQAALVAAEAKLDSLKAGTRPEEVAVAEASVESDTIALVEGLQSAYSVADDAVHNKVDQFVDNPRGTNPQLTFESADSQAANATLTSRQTIEGELSGWQKTLNALTGQSDLAAAVTQAQNALADTSALLSNAFTALSRAVPNQSLSQSTIDTYLSNVATARSNVNSTRSAITAAQGSLANSQKTLKLKQAGSTAQDISAQEAGVSAAQADVDSARAQLGKTLVVAPFAGVVTKMDAKVGSVVSSNSTEISMISSGIFQIEAYVPEVNIAKLEVGDEATTTLDAYGSDTYFAAKVVAIDPAETVKDGVSNYKTTLQFAAADPRIRSGMTANVRITTNLLSNVIVVPQGALITRGNQKFIEIKNGKELEERQVEVGSASAVGNVEIRSGLQDGDIVVLNPQG